jgi:hypothetical protein
MKEEGKGKKKKTLWKRSRWSRRDMNRGKSIKFFKHRCKRRNSHSPSREEERISTKLKEERTTFRGSPPCMFLKKLTK